MSDPYYLRMGSYKSVTNGTRDAYLFRWLILPASSAPGPAEDPFKLLTLKHGEAVLPAANDTFKIEFRANGKYESVEIPVDDKLYFSLFQIGEPKPDANGNFQIPPDDSRLIRQRKTAKEILGQLHASSGHRAIVDRIHRNLMLDPGANALFESAEDSAAGKAQALNYAEKIERIVARHYHGARRTVRVMSLRALPGQRDLPVDPFVRELGDLVQEFTHPSTLRTAGFTAGPSSAAALARASAVAAESVLDVMNARRAITLTIASGSKIEAFRTADGDVSIGRKSVGSLFALERLFDFADLTDEAVKAVRDIRFAADGTEYKVSARLTWMRENGTSLDAVPIPDCFGRGTRIQEPATAPPVEAFFIEDGYFKKTIRLSGQNPPAESDPVFVPTCGDGLVSICVRGVAESLALYSACAVQRTETPAPPAFDQNLLEPIVPQSLEALIKEEKERESQETDEEKKKQARGALLELFPPMSKPDASGLIREVSVTAYQKTMVVNLAESGLNGAVAAEIDRESIVNQDAASLKGLSPNQRVERSVADGQFMRRNGRPPYGRSFYFWVFLKGLDGEWLSKPIPVVRRPPTMRMDGWKRKLINGPGFSLPPTENGNPIDPTAYPVLAASRPVEPPLGGKPSGPGDTPKTLLLDRDLSKSPPKMQPIFTFFHAPFSQTPAERAANTTTYLQWFGITELHAVLFRRVPKVELPKTEMRSMLARAQVDPDLAYHKSQPWFKTTIAEGWEFVDLSKHTEADLSNLEAGLNLLRFKGQESASLDSGYEYYAAVIAKRPEALCYQAGSATFPVLKCYVTPPAPDSTNPPATQTINGEEPPLALSGDFPVRFEYSNPSHTNIAYEPALAEAPAVSFDKAPPPPGPRAAMLNVFPLPPLERKEEFTENELIGLLMQSLTSSDDLAAQLWLAGAVARGAAKRLQAPDGVDATQARRDLADWIAKQLSAASPTELPDARRTRTAAAVSARAVVEINDPNVESQSAITNLGVPVVGSLWSRVTRHNYINFADRIEMICDSDNVTSTARLDLVAPSSDPAIPMLRGERVVVDLFLPGLPEAMGKRKGQVFPPILLLASSVKEVPTADGKGIVHRLSRADLKAQNGQTPDLRPDKDYIYGAVHYTARAQREGADLLKFQDPLWLEQANGSPNLDGIGCILAISLSADAAKWITAFGEVRAEDVTAGGSRLKIERAQLKWASEAVPSDGPLLTRLALVQDRPIKSLGYGKNGSAQRTGRFFDILEGGQEDFVAYIGRHLVPGHMEPRGPGKFVTLPVVGPAGLRAFKARSSVYPAMPQLTAVIAQPWNLQVEWTTERLLDDTGNRQLVYDDSNFLQFQADFRPVRRETERGLRAGGKTLLEILRELKAKNWSSLYGADGQRNANRETVQRWLEKPRPYFAAVQVGDPPLEATTGSFLSTPKPALVAKALLAPPGAATATTSLLYQSLTIRRSEFEWRFRARALENLAEPEYVLESEWSSWTEWARPLPLEIAFMDWQDLGETEGDLPCNELKIELASPQRSLQEQQKGLLYRTIVYRFIAKPEREPDSTEFQRQSSAVFVSGPGIWTSVGPRGVTITFTFKDYAVAPAHDVRNDYRYRYQVEVLLLVEHGSVGPMPGGLNVPEEEVITRSALAEVPLAAQHGGVVRFREDLPTTSRIVPRVRNAALALSPINRLLKSGWSQRPGQNVFFPSSFPEAKIPFEIAHSDTLAAEAAQVLVIKDAGPFQYLALRGAEWDAGQRRLRMLPGARNVQLSLA